MQRRLVAEEKRLWPLAALAPVGRDKSAVAAGLAPTSGLAAIAEASEGDDCLTASEPSLSLERQALRLSANEPAGINFEWVQGGLESV